MKVGAPKPRVPHGAREWVDASSPLTGCLVVRASTLALLLLAACARHAAVWRLPPDLIICDSDAGCSFVAERTSAGCSVSAAHTIRRIGMTEIFESEKFVACPDMLAVCGKAITCDCSHVPLQADPELRHHLHRRTTESLAAEP